MSGRAAMATLRPAFGTTSGPSAECSLILALALRSSCRVRPGMSTVSPDGDKSGLNSSTVTANSVATPHRTRDGELGNLVLGPLRRDMTVSYGLPQASRTTSSQRRLQHWHLLALMASRSWCLVTANSARRTSSFGHPRACCASLRAPRQVRWKSEIPSVHQYTSPCRPRPVALAMDVSRGASVSLTKVTYLMDNPFELTRIGMSPKLRSTTSSEAKESMSAVPHAVFSSHARLDSSLQ
uniref:Uncharacterized protein n=1 Tax=Trichogramma kaykai TaxID=54128 RepID=A0ABD2W345_9HYME